MKRRHGIFYRFTIIAILLGIFPMALTVLGLFSAMEERFVNVMSENYLQTAVSIEDRIDAVFARYDSISKLPYYYSFSSGGGTSLGQYMTYDNLRRLFEQDRKWEIDSFLKNIVLSDNSIKGAHFVGRTDSGDDRGYHVDRINSYIASETLFFSYVDRDGLDMTTKDLVIYPPHPTSYFSGNVSTTFTIARNYFDIRGDVVDPGYVGTMYIDVDISTMEEILHSVNLDAGEEIYVMVDGMCWLSNVDDMVGASFEPEELGQDGDILFHAPGKDHPVSTYILVHKDSLFSVISVLYGVAIALLFFSAILFTIGMVLLSRRISRPMKGMMKEMQRVERGDFDISLPVDRNDEIGELSARFNEMSKALKGYIDKVYASQLRQKEAECTALKSQIYPHFLYNTLEVIRMTAISGGDEKVAGMIEALSEQIHYLIGPLTDFVPLSAEVEIVRKYVYLLNSRISGHIELETPKKDLFLEVPKLILQPIVENAYIHGIKPKGGTGKIRISVETDGTKARISVMNNGQGMTADELASLAERLKGDEIGVRDEYNWKSIGLKNVYDRVRLIYGEGYGLEIDSIEDVGTIVTITVPEKRYEEREDDKTCNGR